VFTRAKSFDRNISTKEELYAIGKELLEPEWPLRIRLLGLRVTKLKDLKMKDDQGIKRVSFSLLLLLTSSHIVSIVFWAYWNDWRVFIEETKVTRRRQ
jgi:hypothetical protein